ncbi:flagellar motor protein MotA [Vibrio albus]|uniref:Flagellar motor protein MotA n=1 Tax=Vibrio albus TaxID=2200953 RepID=A0A2U3BC37_9VIBR|nr:MotA/TolQ/ExbB proton channel family protein [Vibrio albus]PWI34361.1 flagellar motor protein MotA [Vibrio albus]
MNKLTSLLCLTLVAVMCASSVSAADKLLDSTKAAYKEQRQKDRLREADFHQTEVKLQAQKKALQKQIAALQAESDRLSDTFSQNEERLAEKEKALYLATGSLGELFGVVRQVAKELQVEMKQSVASIGQEQQIALIDDIVAAKTLPSALQLHGLWTVLSEQIKDSGHAETVTVNYVGGDGVHTDVTAKRLGSLGLLGDNGYLKWDGVTQTASDYRRQPEQAPTRSSVLTENLQPFAIDASRGTLLEQLGNKPGLSERFAQGGAVGKVIAGLLLLGLLIGAVRGVSLLRTQALIRVQLKKPQQPGNNPLGRVLKVYQEDKALNVEALELRLLESVVDEQQLLEKGLSLIKLFAALAPMLGLLGTVTGMIETFQTITQFGNADPRVMAGGISMALVTTVLGLIAAMPLLLLHNILSSQASNISVVIEKQGIGLVAERAEQQAKAAA